ncbi:hypothetical protein L6452_16690 [Arctium lappa]|uniref:Uncharacterized protein n=1 Tax=Arctium lappa TaxID=4217 RepID=A0ACB9C1B9_ARCLA|nr:hypothetical protein L6452_16690 [Arctium lappa]
MGQVAVDLQADMEMDHVSGVQVLPHVSPFLPLDLRPTPPIKCCHLSLLCTSSHNTSSLRRSPFSVLLHVLHQSRGVADAEVE